MKERRGQAFFTAQQMLLRCPVCGSSGSVAETGAFCCTKGHNFDLAAKGYYHFLAGTGRNEIYDEALFAARSQVFEGGFYHGLLQVLQEVIGAACPPGQGKVLVDVGCGEGFYAAAFADAYTVFALDNAKDAILRACRRSCGVGYLVANLAAVPLANHCVDVILDVLTPANYQEFTRLLSPAGLVVKVLPGPGYLQEVRRLAAPQLRCPTYQNEEILRHFNQHLACCSQQQVCETFPVTPGQAKAFWHMTPLTNHLPETACPWEQLQEITLDLVVIAGRPRACFPQDGLAGGI